MITIADVRAKFPQYSDVSDGDLVRAVHRKFYADMPYGDFLKGIDFRGKSSDPTEGMSGWEKFKAGTGKAVYDIGRGVKQLATGASMDDAKAMDVPLMKTGAGLAGNIIGNAAMLAPTAFIPGANTYTGAGLIGAAAGAVQPIASDESRLVNTGVGATAGMGGHLLGRALGRVIRPTSPALSAEESALAKAATKEGIPLTLGQATGSKPIQVTESALENLPFTAGRQAAVKEAQQRAFTQAALKRAGISGDVADAGTLLSQRNAVGNQIRNIAEGNTLDFYRQGASGKPLISALDDILVEAEKRGKTASEPVRDVIMNIVNEIGENGSMAGRNYQAWRQTLRPLSRTGDNAHAFGQIRKALDTHFNEQIATSGGAKAWQDANRQYANLKTVIDAMGGPGQLPAQGQVAPSQLNAALGRAVGREGRALGAGDLNQLSKVGQMFVKDNVPNSGTAQRLFMQNLMSGGAAVPGAGIGYAVDGPEGAAYGGLLGAGMMLGGPRAVQSVLHNPALRPYLMNGLLPLNESGRNAIAAASRLGLLGYATSE